MFPNPAVEKMNRESYKRRQENCQNYGVTAYKTKSTKSHHHQLLLKNPSEPMLKNLQRPPKSEMGTPSRQVASGPYTPEYQKILENKRKYSTTAYKQSGKSASAPTTPQAERKKPEAPMSLSMSKELKLALPSVEEELDMHSTIETLRRGIAEAKKPARRAVPKKPLLAIRATSEPTSPAGPSSPNSDEEFLEEMADIGMDVLQEVVPQETWLLAILNARRLRVFFNYLASKLGNFQSAAQLFLVFVGGVLVGQSQSLNTLADGAAASWEAFLNLVTTVETYDPLNE